MSSPPISLHDVDRKNFTCIVSLLLMQFPHILWYQKIHYRLEKRLSLRPNLSQIKVNVISKLVVRCSLLHNKTSRHRREVEVSKHITTNLTFMGPCIVNIFPSITNKMQRYTIYLFLWNALHVSGGSSAHHQELKTLYTAGSSKGLTKYPMLYIQLWAPDDGRRNRLKHVEHFTEINCLTLHLICYTWK